MSQTSYPLNIPIALAGLIADLNQGYYIRTGLNEETVALPFGIGFTKVGATVDDGYKLPALTGSVLAGIGVFSQGMNNIGSSGWAATAGIPPSKTQPFNLLKRGTIWVIVEEAVVAGDIAWHRFATGAGGTQGVTAWGKTVDTASRSLVKGARYMTSQGTIGGLAVLDFDAAVAAS